MILLKISEERCQDGTYYEGTYYEVRWFISKIFYSFQPQA